MPKSVCDTVRPPDGLTCSDGTFRGQCFLFTFFFPLSATLTLVPPSPPPPPNSVPVYQTLLQEGPCCFYPPPCSSLPFSDPDWGSDTCAFSPSWHLGLVTAGESLFRVTKGQGAQKGRREVQTSYVLHFNNASLFTGFLCCVNIVQTWLTGILWGRAGEIAHQLEVLVALPEDLGSVSSTHVSSSQHLWL